MSNKNKQQTVYTSTELSDLLSSPTFYSVIALTFILGFSAIFGFLQNPRKLKTVVDVISEKVSATQSRTVSFGVDKYVLLQAASKKASSTKGSHNKASNYLYPLNLELEPNRNIQRVSFNYDITSNQFWGNLDSGRIESASEESQRQSTDASMIGTPLSPEYHSADDGDTKYSMSEGLLRL